MLKPVPSPLLNGLSKTCVVPMLFWGQPAHNYRINSAWQRRFSIAHSSTMSSCVGKYRVQAPIYSTLTHNQTMHVIRRLTDVRDYLSTLSTPPITTTTKYINI